MRWSAALFCSVIAFTSVLAQQALVPTLQIDWNTVDVGGGESAAEGFTFTGTIGQIDAGGSATMSGGGFEFTGGFWPGVRQVCLADVAPIHPEGGAGDGLVNVQDLLTIINHWNSNHWLYDIAPPGGDGVVNVQDMIAVLNAWGACE